MVQRCVKTWDILISHKHARSWKDVRMPPDIWFEIELLRREAFGELSQSVEKELVAMQNA